MSKSIVPCIVVSMALMALAGCDRARQAVGAAGSAVEGAASAVSGDEAVKEKFNAYNAAFNKLVDDSWGVGENFKRYSKRNPANQDPSGNVFFSENVSTLEQAVGKLKEGRAINAGGKDAENADAKVDALLPKLEALLAQWKELKPYFDTKAYRDDKLAKMKAADATLRANYEASLAAIEDFDATLTAYGRARAEARLADLKKSGDMPMYYTVQSMQLADYLVTAAGEDDMDKADELLPQLEASLAELGKAQPTMSDEGVASFNKNHVGRIHTLLGQMIGEYRDYKQSGKADDGSDMIEKYNDAIEEYNRL